MTRGNPCFSAAKRRARIVCICWIFIVISISNSGCSRLIESPTSPKGLATIFGAVGVPGLALYVLLKLYQRIDLPKFPKVSKKWVGPLVLAFMVLIATIVLFSLYLYRPPRISPGSTDSVKFDRLTIFALEVSEESPVNGLVFISKNNAENPSPETDINGKTVLNLGFPMEPGSDYAVAIDEKTNHKQLKLVQPFRGAARVPSEPTDNFLLDGQEFQAIITRVNATKWIVDEIAKRRENGALGEDEMNKVKSECSTFLGVTVEKMDIGIRALSEVNPRPVALGTEVDTYRQLFPNDKNDVIAKLVANRINGGVPNAATVETPVEPSDALTKSILVPVSLQTAQALLMRGEEVLRSTLDPQEFKENGIVGIRSTNIGEISELVKAGLKDNDVVLSINGNTTPTWDDLVGIMVDPDKMFPDGIPAEGTFEVSVEVKILRDKNEMILYWVMTKVDIQTVTDAIAKEWIAGRIQ